MLSNHAYVRALRDRVAGTVLSPQDDGYDAARAVYNGLVDRRPALIVRARSSRDVVEALRLARDAGLEVSVRGGGHNVAGRAVSDGGLMISLADMRAVKVDAGARTATVQGGATWADVNAATQPHGLAVTGGVVSTTGVAGLTLGGGLGWLMAKHGLAADNLESVELVTAAGEVLQVGADTHPDLFWALRGGGGNFGVATALTYRLHRVGTVTGGLIAHPLDAAPELLRFYRDAVAGAPDDLTVFAGLIHAPDGAKLAALVVFHTGDPETAKRELEPFTGFGSPAMVQVGELPYETMNTLLDAGYPDGSLNYWRASFTRGLPDALIDAAVEHFKRAPSPMSAILLEHFHGAVTRIGATDTAVPHREPGWNLFLPTVWTDPDTTDANIRWTRDTHAALAPHLADRRWLNYLADDEAGDAIRAAYGPNYERLRQVKRRYDPANVFHGNHNITP
ncbi:FAD-binding oxidoreductase [Solirubrobacter soli]|uniref:FAD-binding oxidoreductase n=1 Tax=Solirubrobacter soli TaxID=363832 RepID=UPI00056D8CE9|nr:FAD-binding oxidoreductase [Solirubrobacter soli]